MPPPSVAPQRKNYWIFLTCLAVGVMVLGGVATSRYGAGVASDSVKYMAVAQNLLDGNGLMDHRGFPLLAWPPLYSLLLAGLSYITRLDVFVTGWYFNVFLLGANLFLSGVIFQRVFLSKPLYAYLSSLFVFLSISTLRVNATVSSDALYVTFTLLFLIVLDGYVQHRSYRAFAWVVVLCAAAPLLRYVGLALPATAMVIILVEQRKAWRVFLRDGFILGLIAIAPIFWWLIIHNVLTYGSLWGTPSDQVVDVWQNTNLALTKMLHWFVPYFEMLMPLLIKPFVVLGAVALLVVVPNLRSKGNWQAWLRDFSLPAVYPTMVYAFIYFVAVALTSITADHRYLYSDRYYVILLVPTMIFAFVTYDRLLLPHLKFSARHMEYALIVIFGLWSLYPIYSLREYVANALVRGEPSEYNLFNTRAYHESTIVLEMQKLRSAQPDAIFYSNYVDAVWFYTRQSARLLPVRTVPDIATAYAGWPQDKPGYIIWFKPNEYKHYLGPDELAEFGALTLVYTSESGDIYYAQAR